MANTTHVQPNSTQPSLGAQISPISKAAEEILWMIFMINTEDPTEHRPLDTTRKSSQVCRRWRYILLGTASIWGRLIDWQSLNQTTDKWRDEVLRRSGASLLWINYPPGSDSRTRSRGCGWKMMHRGAGPKVEESTQRFFYGVIRVNWERVQEISFSSVLQKEFVKGLREVVRREAPNLQTFTLPRLPRGLPQLQGDMFSKHAPRLRSFCAKNTHCNLHISWMTNIRDLQLEGPYGNKEICEVLAHLGSLESLKLGRHQTLDDYRSPLPIHLPKLRTLVLRHCLHYLRDIIAPPLYTLILLGAESDGQQSYQKYIATAFHNHMSITSARSICLSYYRDFLKIGTQERSPTVLLGDLFDIDVTHSLSDTELGGFVDSLASHRFSTVTALAIIYSDLEVQHQRLSYHCALTRFLSHFSSLEKLTIHEQDIHFLIMIESDPLTFLNLRTLVVTGFDYYQGASGRYFDGPASGAVERFLKVQRGSGAPVTTVDLTATEYSRFNLPRSLDPGLEELVGLRIIWKWDYGTVEYECGSGHPENLRFIDISPPRSDDNGQISMLINM